MTELSGRKVLLAEDEGVVALMIEHMLEDLGCEVAASVARVADACAVAATVEIDFAVLDVNLDDQPVFPVAELLLERQIPFIFSTGYGTGSLPSEFSSHPTVSKPFSLTELQQTIALVFQR